MAGRNKGFDPLSSLFEAPDPNRGLPLPDVDEDEAEAPVDAGRVELNDPLMKRPTPAPPPAPGTVDAPAGHSAEDKASLARRLAMEALARAQDAVPLQEAVPPDDTGFTLPAEDSEELRRDGFSPELEEPMAPAPASLAAAPPVEDKLALARRLAAEAMARAQAAPPTVARPSGDQDKAALARKVAAEAIARAAQAAPARAPASPGDADKLALARKLAAEAVARAAAPAAAAPAPAAAAPSTDAGKGKAKGRSKAAAPAPEERARAGRSRIDALAARARKPVTALEAAREAVRHEEERHAHDLRKEASRLRDVVQELIPEWLPGIGTLFVANAIAVQQRDLLKALWRGHRAKFLADGQLERAVGAAAVLAALDQAPEGTLVAAHAVTDASDYLVWLDLDKRSLVAAFPDARAYFAAGA